MRSVAPAVNGHDVSGNQPHRTWAEMVYSHQIDDARPIKVICIGAGISGIVAGVRFPQEIKNLTLVIYEKNAEVGGTWYENTYPGVRCDIPSAGYQFTFESNTQWSEYYASGPEIQKYLVNVAKKYGVHRYCQFHHQFQRARWLEDIGQWEVVVKNLLTGQEVTDLTDIVITATGILNRWKWPEIPGLEDFQGKKAHTANWDQTIDLNPDVEVALIGAGSSGVQVLPTIQPLVKRIDHYMKGKNWISPLGAGYEELAARHVTTGNFKHTPDELELFKKDPKAYMTFRHRIENSLNQAQLAVFYGTDAQRTFHDFTHQSMSAKLSSRPDILDSLLPDFPVGCRRLTPGPGYLEACVAGNVDYIGTEIKRIHKDSIETVDGKIRKVDLIICATGFDVSRQGESVFTGQDGITLDEVWDPIPEAYMSICPPKMPNMFMFLGPNGGPGAGSTIHMIEWVGDYMVRCIKKIQREHLKSMVVSARANQAFSRQIDLYFKKTVFAQPCRSWYKRGQKDGRLVTPWPGSGVHAKEALDNPRWEDFDYELLPETQENQLAWLGDGLTKAQHDGTSTTDYLESVKMPTPVHPEIAAGDMPAFDSALPF